MSIILQFNCLTHNETARKAMETYVGILQKAFEHYQNLWEDYIKLQEKYGQCIADSSSQVTIDTPCTKTKDETTFQQLNNANVQKSNSFPLLELDTLNSINFDVGTSPLDVCESLHRDIDGNNLSESPVFSKTFLRTGNNLTKKFIRSPKTVCNDSTSDMKTHHSIEKVSSKYNHKLEISTTHHVGTTILPDGKRLKQSRLAFYPVKNNEKMVLSSSIDKHEPTNISHNIKQNFIEEIAANSVAISNATVNENDTTNISEISEDVIEISPTQRNITSKVKQCLKLKRKIPTKHIIKISPSKNKWPDSPVPEIIDIDFRLYASPKHTFTQMEDDKSLMNTAVNTLKDNINISYLSPIKMHNKTSVQIKKSIKVQKEDQLLNKIQNLKNISDLAYEDETLHLPTAVNRNDMDNLNLDDIENKPPEKKMLLDRFNVLSKRKTDISEQLNMRCKTDRTKLNGLDCWECRKYYKNLSLSKEELQRRKNQCSRHRHKYERPNTPEGFWDPEFPETLSCTYRQNKN